MEFNLEAGRALKKIGQDKVLENAPDFWKIEAESKLRVLCMSQKEITADDLRARMTSEPHNPKAYGPIFRNAAIDKIIMKTGFYKPSERVEAHCRPLMVWKSLIFNP